ncbi:16311_t:CDS:1, partial [Dentiscutata heterogama]
LCGEFSLAILVLCGEFSGACSWMLSVLCLVFVLGHLRRYEFSGVCS